VLFDKDFQWTYGGKLHGLGSKVPVTGGKKRNPRKWSARTTFKKEGYVSTYLYDQDKKNKYGIGNVSDAPVFFKNQWHHVELEIKLNSANQADGFAYISIDGKKQATSDNVIFRGEEGRNTEIQTFIFSTFHGGNKLKWAPVDELGNLTTVYAYFDNFEVIDSTKSKSGLKNDFD